MSEYISPEKVLDNPEYIRIPLKMDNLGGVKMGSITHYTRVVSDKDGWDEIIYFRYIGNTSDKSPQI